MSKIPTAKEFIEEFITLHSKQNKNLSDDDMMELVVNNYKEFAKLHVKAAIEECIESAPSGSSTDTVSYEDVVEALKDCYPLENIK